MSEKRNWLKEILEWLHHAYWIREFLVSSGTAAIVIKSLSGKFPIFAPYSWPAGILLAGILMYFIGSITKRSQAKSALKNQVSSVQTSNAANGSALPGINIKEFFRTSYRSSMEEDIRNNFRIIARQESPNNPEEFYLKFIGTGLPQAFFDNIWWPMFRSQLLALMQINRKGGMLPKSDVKTFYDEAAKEYTTQYAKDNFDRWFSYLTKNGLVLDHPSQMVEITVRGKDFLKYLTHWGKEPKDKRL
jgi:hypothetical protein